MPIINDNTFIYKYTAYKALSLSRNASQGWFECVRAAVHEPLNLRKECIVRSVAPAFKIDFWYNMSVADSVCLHIVWHGK